MSRDAIAALSGSNAGGGVVACCLACLLAFAPLAGATSGDPVGSGLGTEHRDPASEYDRDLDGEISDSELRAALVDWVQGEISDHTLAAVVEAWATGGY